MIYFLFDGDKGMNSSFSQLVNRSFTTSVFTKIKHTILNESTIYSHPISLNPAEYGSQNCKSKSSEIRLIKLFW